MHDIGSQRSEIERMLFWSYSKRFAPLVTRPTQSLLFRVNFYGGVALVTTNHDAEFHNTVCLMDSVGECPVLALGGWVVEQHLLCAPDAIYTVVPFCVGMVALGVYSQLHH